MHAQGLQIFHHAALQVAAAAGLHGGVHQTLPPGHAVKVVLLWAQACMPCIHFCTASLSDDVITLLYCQLVR